MPTMRMVTTMTTGMNTTTIIKRPAYRPDRNCVPFTEH